MTLPIADELVAPRPGGRTYALEAQPLLGDCAPSGRIRLDGLARWLQDVAYDDVADAGVADHALWVVRRVRLRVSRFPRFGERHRVTTFCSGIGRMWAARRTTITPVDEAAGQRAGGGADTPVAEAVALWIHLDPQRRVPSLLSEREAAIYARAAGDGRVHHRLRHPRPDGEAAPVGHWCFRESDCDLADHVNNAAYWEPLEDELLGAERERGATLAEIDAEIEFRTPAQPGAYTILGDGDRRRWLVGDGEIYASTLLMNARTTSGSN